MHCASVVVTAADPRFPVSGLVLDGCSFRTVSGTGIRSLDPAHIQLRVDYYTNDCSNRNRTDTPQGSTDAEVSTESNVVVIILSAVVIAGMLIFILSRSSRVQAIFARNPGGNEARENASVASKSTDESDRNRGVPTKPPRPESGVIGPTPGAKITTVQMDWETTESPGFVPRHHYNNVNGAGAGGSGVYTSKGVGLKMVPYPFRSQTRPFEDPPPPPRRLICFAFRGRFRFVTWPQHVGCCKPSLAWIPQ